jgi:hypothetical protein
MIKNGEIMNKDDSLLDILKEREKELNCLYKVDEILSNNQLSFSEIFNELIKIIPTGWRFPELCHTKIVFKNISYQTPEFLITPYSEKFNIKAEGKILGNIEVAYEEEVTRTSEGYFLDKERKLIRTIADRIGQMVIYRQMKSVVDEWEMAKVQNTEASKYFDQWEVIIDFFRHTDHSMLLHISRKLITHLLLNGVKEAADIMSHEPAIKAPETGYSNSPTVMEPLEDIICISERTFRIAKKYLTNNEITLQVKRWIQEVSAYSLIKAIGCIAPSLRNIIDELNKYRIVIKDEDLLYSPKERWLSVGLINHFLSDRPEFVNIAKHYISCRDFFDIINRIILPIGSQGKLGGKGIGLFLAQKILEKESKELPLLESVKTPKTWYITTDGITEFLQYNGLEELHEQKYKELQEIRVEYPNLIQLMKNSKLPPEIHQSLSVVLDDFGDVPLIVRSSSILEDQAGAAFSGKYKSLFIANQGTKKQRIEALKDAIKEVYASVFNPDSFQYRSERGLLDFYEEMGILIQEVIGTRVGKYFFPLFSGVAFSNNEYCWSPRISREDGLIRMVPGLGTRAVDRISDDFPVLISPGQPGIQVNIVPEEIRRYSPKRMDVINLEKGTFETIDIVQLVREYGSEIHQLDKIISLFEFNHIRKANKYDINFEKDDVVVTFNGVITESSCIKQISTMLKTLKAKMGLPVDIEFAYNGQYLYLLQCRPQSSGGDSLPPPIPKDLPNKDIIFSAFKHIANGVISNISHIVYIDAEEYHRLNDIEDLKNVGRVVGMLNSILPKHQFILIGPGRWGSRGDIKLGVPVGYADICNTAALVEVSSKKNGYFPELSFGTHFFQDLVEAKIQYIPIYPEDEGVIFNWNFLYKTRNILSETFPEYTKLEDVIKVINVPESIDGKTLKISMNAELGEAVGFLTDNSTEGYKEKKKMLQDKYESNDSAWRWRFYMAEHLAGSFDSQLFGVVGLYLFGSTNNGTAGPGSDIDLLVHFRGNERQKSEMVRWLNGWSLCLAEMNYLKTGYRMDGLLDIHIITDEDIRKKDSFAILIDSSVEPAYPLRLKNQLEAIRYDA